MIDCLNSKVRPKSKFNTLPKPVVIVDIINENSNTKSFIFNESFKEAEPGQFVMVWLPGVKEAPFCVANINPFKLTICNVGELSGKINSLKKGDKLWIRGPYGTYFESHNNKNPILVGGGYGAAPLAFLANKLLNKNIKPIVALGGCTKDVIIGGKEFQKIGIEPIYTTDDGSFGIRGRVTKPVEELLEDKKADIIYGIGPNPMLDVLLELSEKYKVPAELSYEAMIKCGIGNCGACECKGKLVCVEGPVLKFNF